MDRKWISANRLSKEYEIGVKEFVEFAVKNAKDPNRVVCPCLKCCFGKRVREDELEGHLVCNGIDQSYTCWIRHGEKKKGNINFENSSTYASTDFDTDTYEPDRVDEIAKAVEEDLRDCPKMFESLLSDAEKELYNGCTKFTRLSAILKLYNLKASNGWSDKSFTELLTLIKDMLPDDNELPSRTYEAKRILCSIGMSYERIHACPNDCILFRNEYELLKACPKCNVSRYKKKESTPAKVVWYFPIIPRFRRMYRSEEDSKHLTWHADERIRDGMFRHPADSPQWAKIDHEYPEFGIESRNLRLALSTDGMNPHGLQSISHSTWPVILVIYNLPPWLCMKRKFMMLSLLISGPKQPGNDIDVYLTPLIENLKSMWETGVEVGWNESGQPVDPNSSMFVSYIGAVVRQNVPITIDNWRDKALKDAKDIIWNDIQTTFVLDEERKSYVLRVAGKIHRGFRSHLSNFYLKDREGNTNAEPPKIYQHYISKDEWSAFVSKRSDPAFVNISKANRERASNPKHPYKKSRMGYARLEQKIETIEQSSETQEGNKDTCRDILGKVFNVPEYSGRVRGKGFGVTPKSFFPQEKRQKPSNEEVLEKLRILSEQVALLVNTNKDKQLPVQLQPEIQMESETGSCNVGLKSIPEGVTTCVLYLSSPTQRKVGKGILHNTSGEVLHNIPIPAGHVKVSPTVAFEPTAPLPISVGIIRCRNFVHNLILPKQSIHGAVAKASALITYDGPMHSKPAKNI
ncbi:uncharacterized protein [Cicer arietinum]|uniref:uncharacterized protein n=1 Tax=Cicer arietinum TaxID=3827 RepID=UPI003CC52C47